MFNYCPNCALPTQNHRYSPYHCVSCKFAYFHNTAAAVAVIIHVENEILMTIRAKEPGLGLLDLPGGFVDANESLEEALIRELQEELNIRIKPSNLSYLCSAANTYPYKNIENNTCDAVFVLTLLEKPDILIDKSEVQQVKWLELAHINLEQVAFLSMRKAIKRFAQEKVAAI